MNRRKVVIIIWFIVNLILGINYYLDASTIKCEPCLPELDCTPCQTTFMANFWLFFIIWNVLMMIALYVLKKLNPSSKSDATN
jgi:hypothetical protein